MSIIVKDGRFQSADGKVVYQSLEDKSRNSDHGFGVDIPSDTPVQNLARRIGKLPSLRIAFPTPGDGRGFSIARTLRQNGYKGHLRAYGHIISDQYPLALRCGFDDIEIPDDLARRQGEDQWRDAYFRNQNAYRETLSTQFGH